MLRLSRNSVNVKVVKMSTERIPAIHVSGHDMTTEAGVDGTGQITAGKTFVPTPIVRSQDEPGRPASLEQPKFEASGHWTPPRSLFRFFIENRSNCSTPMWRLWT